MDGKIWSGFRGRLILREYDPFPILCYHVRGIVAETRLHPAEKPHILAALDEGISLSAISLETCSRGPFFPERLSKRKQEHESDFIQHCARLLIQCGIHVNYYYKVVMGVDKSIAKMSRLWFVTR
jgi:hypothetical protein